MPRWTTIPSTAFAVEVDERALRRQRRMVDEIAGVLKPGDEVAHELDAETSCGVHWSMGTSSIATW